MLPTHREKVYKSRSDRPPRRRPAQQDIKYPQNAMIYYGRRFIRDLPHGQSSHPTLQAPRPR
jgi:hypothetical protein